MNYLQYIKNYRTELKLFIMQCSEQKRTTYLFLMFCSEYVYLIIHIYILIYNTLSIKTGNLRFLKMYPFFKSNYYTT